MLKNIQDKNTKTWLGEKCMYTRIKAKNKTYCIFEFYTEK